MHCHTRGITVAKRKKGGVYSNRTRHVSTPPMVLQKLTERSMRLSTASHALDLLYTEPWWKVKHHPYGREHYEQFSRLVPLHAAVLAHPDHAWQMWRFKRPPNRWWIELGDLFSRGDPVACTAVYTYMTELARECGIQNPRDWKKITFDSATSLRLVHLGSLQRALQVLYPSNEHDSLGITKSPDLGAVTKTRVYADSTMSWSEPIHRYEFLKFVLKNMANDDLEGMYAVDRSQLIRFGGRGLLHHYNECSSMSVMVEFPVHCWFPWRFSRRSNDWKQLIAKGCADGDPVAHAAAENYLAILQTSKDATRTGAKWVDPNIPTEHLTALQSLVTHRLMHKSTENNDLLSDFLSTVQRRAVSERYPSNSSLPQLRQFTATQSTPPNWNRAEDRRRYFDFVRAQIGLSFESLYKLTIKAIVQSLPGRALLALFNDNVRTAIMTEHPEHWWVPWRFKVSPRGWFHHLSQRFFAGDPVATAVVREYIDEIGHAHGVSTLEDWYQVSYKKFDRATQRQLLLLRGQLSAILIRLHPHHPWDFQRFGRRKKDQRAVTKLASVLLKHGM